MVCVAPIAESSTQVLKYYAFGVQKYRSHVWMDSNIQSDYGTLDMEHWYTIDGRKLNGKPTMKGIYVVNGKKVVIK